MKRIESIEELLSADHGENVFVVSKGDVQPLYFCGSHPKMIAAVLIKGINHGEAKVITDSFIKREVCLIGTYNPEFIGKLIISQLEQEISTIEEVYLNG